MRNRKVMDQGNGFRTELAGEEETTDEDGRLDDFGNRSKRERNLSTSCSRLER
jgi:hypothetical protein